MAEETSASLLATFRNSLVYTACSEQVRIFVAESNGGQNASVILIITFTITAMVLQRLKAYVKRVDAGGNGAEWIRVVTSLKEVSVFSLDLMSNLATQLVSTIAAGAISDAVRGGTSTGWSLLGSALCIVLLWLLTAAVSR